MQHQVAVNADTSYFVGLVDQAIAVYVSNQTSLAGERERAANGTPTHASVAINACIGRQTVPSVHTSD